MSLEKEFLLPNKQNEEHIKNFIKELATLEYEVENQRIEFYPELVEKIIDIQPSQEVLEEIEKSDSAYATTVKNLIEFLEERKKGALYVLAKKYEKYISCISENECLKRIEKTLMVISKRSVEINRFTILALWKLKSMDNSLKTIDLVVKLIKKNPSVTHFSWEIASILKKDPAYSSQKLLELTKNENLKIKQRALALLHCLEFGQIGISENGVKYLEKMYDLGKDNNPDYFAQRLTAKGEIGIFDENRVLQKYFQLEGLEKPEETAKPQIHEFVYSTLFFEKENETPEEIAEREKYLQEFKENYFQFYDDQFWQKTGVRFNNLNFKEQGWFLIFYKNANENKREELIKFASQYKENGLKSFLSLEFDQDGGDKILEIGKKLKFDQAHFVFSKIAQLADLADKENKELAEIVFKTNENKTISNVQLPLLQKAHQIILDFSQVVDAKDLASEAKIKKLLEDLEKTRIEIEFLAEVLKNLPEKERKDSLEVIKGLDFEQKKVADLSEKEKEEILKNAEENWRKDNPEVAEEIISHLKRELHPETEKEKEIARQSNGHLLKYNDAVIGFAKFKPLSQTEVYAGSLNIHISLRGAEIGKQFFEKVLKEELPKGKIITAETSLRNPATACYVEKFNFVIDGIIPDSFGKNHPFFTIRIDKNLNENLETRNAEKFSLEEIRSLFREQEDSGLSVEDLIKEKNIIVFKLNKNSDINGCPAEEELKKASQLMLPEKDDNENLVQEKEHKFIGTRYLYDKKESCWYVVFEKID